MKIICFTAYSENLRATAVIRCLRDLGHEVEVSRSHGAPGSIWELALTLLPNCLHAMTCRPELAVGFKPHLNVTLPLWICKMRGIKTWVDVDDLDHSYREGFLSKLVEWTQKPFPRLCDVVSYHHPKLREFLLRHMGCLSSQLVSLPQGVDVSHFGGKGNEVSCEKLRAQWNLTGKKTAIYTAHLNVASDLEPILMAWGRVMPVIPDACLLVVGGGPHLQKYRDMAMGMGLSSVVFVGTVEHRDVREWFSISDAALIYFSERVVNEYRCSLKLREYFAAGLPVVSNDFGELGLYTEFTYGGSTSVEGFASRIIKVLKGERDGREERACRYAQKHLEWRQVVSQGLEKVWELLKNTETRS